MSAEIFPETGQTMPVLFIGHGSPMNAIEIESVCQRLGCRRGRSARTAGDPVRVRALGIARDGSHRDGPTAHDLRFLRFSAGVIPGPVPRPRFARAGRTGPAGGAGVWRPRGYAVGPGSWHLVGVKQMFPAAKIPVIQLSLDTAQPAGLPLPPRSRPALFTPPRYSYPGEWKYGPQFAPDRLGGQRL